MISSAYIHEFDMFDEITEAIMMSESTVTKMIREYELKCEEIKTRNFFESSDFEDPYISEGAKEVVETIGRAVEATIKKVIELIDKVVSIFNERIWNHKSDAQKLEKIMEKHPNLKDDIKFAVANGDIDIKDIKSMQDLMDGTYDILDKINKGKVDQTKAEKMFAAVNDKWEKFGKPIVAVAAGVTTVITAYKAVNSLFPDLAKSKIEGAKLKGKLKELETQAKIDAGDSKLNSLKNSIINKTCGIINGNLRGQAGLFNRLGGWLTSTLSRFETSGDKLKDDLKKVRAKNNMVNSILNRDDVEKAKAIKKAQDAIDRKNAGGKAYGQRMAQRKADAKYDADNPKPDKK